MARRVAKESCWLATLACLAGCSAALAAPQWQPLGPGGGSVIVATSPADRNLVYGIGGSFGYMSRDGGHSWTTVAPLPVGTNLDGLKVRADGQVFAYGYDRIWRSPDGMRSWIAYRLAVPGGEPMFDPRDPQTALLSFGYGIAVKRGDQNPWQIPSTSPDAEMPTHFVFDPVMAGRLLGVGMVGGTVCTATDCLSTYTLKFFKSWTSGASWLAAGIIVPTQQGDTPAPCYPRGFSADPTGRLLLHTDCGLFRSVDAGASWQRLTSPEAVSNILELLIDPAAAGHLYLMGSELHESHDAGDTWHKLPRVPDGRGLHVGAGGDLWASAWDGPYLYDPATRRWLQRHTGINNTWIESVVAGSSGGPVLIGMAHSHAHRSLDHGLTWQPFRLGGQAVVEIGRHATDPDYLVARTRPDGMPSSSQADLVFLSRDGGASWESLPAPAAMPSRNQVMAWAPAGPQPGIVYGIEKGISCAFIRCGWVSVGAARSLDGGKTWSSANTGISDRIDRILVSPADPQSALAFSNYYGLPVYATRDGGQGWARIFADALVLAIVADPAVPDRWYLRPTSAQVFLRTDDQGGTWQALADPQFGTAWANLLIHDDRLYAIGANGAVAVSDDLGARWQTLVDGQADMELHPGSARWGRAGVTILAGGPLGVVELDLSATSVQPRTGLWAINAENNGQSGRGFQLESQGGTLVLTYFGYGADGDGRWYLATGPLQSGRFEGDLVEYRGGTALGGPYAPVSVAGSAGRVSASFSAANAGTLSLPGESACAIGKFAFGGDALPAVAPASGLWIIEAEDTGESGRGFQIEQNGGHVVFTYYGYSADGNGVWYLAAGPMVDHRFSAALVAYRGGTVLGEAYRPASAAATPGEVNLSFTGPTTGTIELPGESARTIRKFGW